MYKRQEIDIASTKDWAENSDWLSLEIRKTERGGAKDEDGTVEFIAKFNDSEGNLVNHHEVSLFKKHQDQWYFVDAEAPKVEQIRRDAPKVGRNDPCTCGSGKKFKKCCGGGA